MPSVPPAARARRLAMWSGPRNISTALLRSFENRSDAAVVDEPLYAFYLERTGKPHPGREAVLAAQPRDWRAVLERLLGPPPGGRALFYQKHMAHHLLPEVERERLDGLEHAFLVRDPARMLASLDRVTPDPGLADTGLPQQVELFRRVRARSGRTPPVIDADDVLADPRGLVGALCAAWEIPFEPSMLAWPPGPRATDGVWAPFWYEAVWRSSGFEPPRPPPPPLPERLRPLHELCKPLYEELRAERLAPLRS